MFEVCPLCLQLYIPGEIHHDGPGRKNNSFLLLQLCGCVLLGLGLWTVLEKWEMVLMMPSKVYEITIWLVVATGALSVLIALLGYTALAFESRHLLAWVGDGLHNNEKISTMIFQYTILLVVVFIAESVIGLLSYVYQDKLGPDLEDTLTQSFISSYGLDHDRTLAADNIQLKVKELSNIISLASIVTQ